MNTRTIPGLAIEFQDTQGGARSVLLKQEFGGTVHQVELHELHARWLAQQLDAVGTSDLQRALLHVEGLTRELHENLKLVHDSGHEDLTNELAQAVALVDFVEFICTGFRPQHLRAPQAANPSTATTANQAGDLFAEGATD